MQVNFLKYKPIYFILSGTLVLAAIVSLIMFGLKPGIDFTGGSMIEVTYTGTVPTAQEVRNSLSSYGQVEAQPANGNEMIIKMQSISESDHQKILSILGQGHQIQEQSFESIGPVIGQELRNKTKVIIILVLLSILLYVAFAFRKVHRPVSSWQYGLAALIALFHDVLIPTGVFAVLGHYMGVEFTIPVVTALLTVLGYSVNDTVVVFDRIREALIKREGATFEDTVNLSLNNTLTRCINTSLTTLLALFAIYFFGGATLRYFSLALIIGIAAGTYSSIFIASPLLVVWLRWRHKIS